MCTVYWEGTANLKGLWIQGNCLNLTLAKKSQEKHGNPGKAWRPWLSWLFPAFFDAGKPGKARKAWKFLAFLERPECSSKKSLESQERALGFCGKRGFCPYKPNPEKPGKAGMTVPGVNIPGFRGKAGHANSWKAKKPRTEIQAFLESWKFCIDYYSSSKPSLGILGFHLPPYFQSLKSYYIFTSLTVLSFQLHVL